MATSTPRTINPSLSPASESASASQAQTVPAGVAGVLTGVTASTVRRVVGPSTSSSPPAQSISPGLVEPAYGGILPSSTKSSPPRPPRLRSQATSSSMASRSRGATPASSSSMASRSRGATPASSSSMASRSRVATPAPLAPAQAVSAVTAASELGAQITVRSTHCS